MKNRFIAAILTFSLTISLLTACSDKTSGEEEAAEPSGGTEVQTAEAVDTTEEEELTDGLPDSDFCGYGFRVLTCMHHQDTYSFVAADEMTGVPLNDALYGTKQYIEDRFNVTISSVDSGDVDTNVTAVKTAVNAGDNAFDITIGHDKKTLALGTDGFLRNLYDFDEFDFSKPWWPSKALDSWSINGIIFAASNYLSYCGLHWTRIITVNKDLAEDLGITVPYDTVREGKWTLDVLQSYTDMAAADLNGDGKMTPADRFGLAMFEKSWYTLQEALDMPVYRRDSEGMPYIDLDIERADEISTRLNSLISDNKFYIAGASELPVMLEGGNYLFAYAQLRDLYTYVNGCNARAGFLSTPKLNEVQEDYINCCTDAPWGIAKFVSGDQEDIIGTIVEAMSCYNYKNVIPTYFEVTLKSRLADSPDDSEMLQLIADTRTIGFVYGYQLPMHDLVENLTKGVGAAALMQKSTKSAQKQLDKLIEAFEKNR